MLSKLTDYELRMKAKLNKEIEDSLRIWRSGFRQQPRFNWNDILLIAALYSALAAFLYFLGLMIGGGKW